MGYWTYVVSCLEPLFVLLGYDHVLITVFFQGSMLTLVSTIISSYLYGTYLPLSPQRHVHHVYDEM